MTTSVFIRNDSPADGEHNSVFVGVMQHGAIHKSTENPLAPGESVTTTVYPGMALVVRESAGD